MSTRSVVLLGSFLCLALVAAQISQQYDNLNTDQFCEYSTCADTQRQSRAMRLRQLAVDAAARQLNALRKQVSTAQVFSANAIFPTRGSVQGGTLIHVCGFGFSASSIGRNGMVTDNRLYCLFRLNQTRMAKVGSEYGVNSATDQTHRAHDQAYGFAGMYKTGMLGAKAGGVPSLTSPLTATEQHYSHLLTSPAKFISSGEITCLTPDISSIPIGFPVTATVAVSINGKEQFHQWTGEHSPVFTFYDPRSTRDGFSNVHTFKSALGRSLVESYVEEEEEDLAVIRRLTPDKYSGSPTGLFTEVIDSQGEL